jgi:hypothetical protein
MTSPLAITDKSTPIKKTSEQQEKKAVWNGATIKVIVLSTTAAISLVVLAAAAAFELIKYAAEGIHDKIWVPDLPTLEEAVKKKFEESFIDRLKNLPGIDFIRLCKHLAICSKDEEEILKQLQNNFHLTNDELKQILGGAHVRLKDGGVTYETWVKTMETKQKRVSSHPSSSDQYGIRGPFVKELLFSKIEENGETYTWFQLENHPVKFGHYIRHMWDYVVYKATRNNQGPYGSSPAIDSRPIILDPRA